MSFLSALFGGNSQYKEKIKVLDPTAYRSAISGKKVQLIDVRTPTEFASGHIKGAKNLDIFQAGKFEAAASQMNKQAPIYLYCRSGSRSKRASHKLVKMGFNEVYDLRGGYLNWN